MPTCPLCQTGYPSGVKVCPEDGAVLIGEPAFPLSGPTPRTRDATDPLVGSTLAERYKITGRIGEGGMGVVYRATHAVIGRDVAVKVLHERYVERPEVAARLMNEARLASSIRNEHIVDIFDFGETADGRTFVVMELLGGESLAQMIRRDGPLGEQRGFEVCLQVADALGAAHERGIIHRDVKPENVFVLRRGDADFVKVLDFGISKTFRTAAPGEAPEPAAARLTQTGMVLGTPLYMSPEQARGEDRIDHRVDVYALGIILYECLTGEVPFRGTNYLGIISDVLNRTATPPREIRPDLAISAAAERVVLRAMAKDREVRYPSMAALGSDLRRVLAGETIEIATAPPPPEERQRSPILAWGGLAALGLAAAVAAILVAGRAAPPTPAMAASPPPAAPTVIASPPPKPAPPSTVIVKVRSNPPGAEIKNGDRRLGVTPQDIELARSDRPVHLTFHLDGREDGATDVIPQIDGEPINIELAAKKPAHHRHRTTATAPSTVGHETLPVPAYPRGK